MKKMLTVVFAITIMAGGLSACSKTDRYTATGALVGAGIGGAVSGDAGGAAIGAVGGGVLGNIISRDR